MKRITLTICAAAFLFAACNNEVKSDTITPDPNKTASSTSPETAPEEPYVAPDTAKMRQAWMEFATPGEMHKVMASTDGTWECEVTHWMTAGAPPSTNKASSTYKTVFNGLYQEGSYRGSFDGMPFEGKSVLAYDNTKKKFLSTWYDNMGSGLMIMEGDYDPATKTFTFEGTSTNPLTKKDCTMKEVIKLNDDGTQTMEMYGPDPMTNKEFKTMVMTMKKKK